MGSLADMIAAMNTNFAMMEHLCCKAEAQRDAAQARVRELEAEVERLKADVAAANERWLEAKSRAEHWERHGLDTYSVTWDAEEPCYTVKLNTVGGIAHTFTQMADAQTRADAAIGREVREQREKPTPMPWCIYQEGIPGSDNLHVCTKRAGACGHLDPMDAVDAGCEEFEPVPTQFVSDAALGADLRCLMGGGLEWEVVDGPWSVNLGDEWTEPGSSADAARAVREWQEGQENPLPDDACGKRLSEQVARFPDEPEPIMTACDNCGVLMPSPGGVDDPRCPTCEDRANAVDPKPAPSPEDAARARIAAAGAKVYEGHAVRVERPDGQCMTISGVPTPTGLEELAAFAEAHRAAQEPPGDAPEAPAEG
jgi:hypothetical protein